MTKKQKDLGGGYELVGNRYTRGRETAPVTLPSGRETLVAHQHKNGVGQCFWYWIRMSCGGWREFDIRDLGGDEQEFMEVACTRAALPKVAEFLNKNAVEGLV